MNKKQLEHGKVVATQALLFATTARKDETVRVGDLREGVRLLFGSEIDAALAEQLQKSDVG